MRNVLLSNKDMPDLKRINGASKKNRLKGVSGPSDDG